MSNQDNVIQLADRVLGECSGCRKPVLFSQSFIRAGRAFVHVACALRADAARQRGGHDFPRPVPPLPPGA